MKKKKHINYAAIISASGITALSAAAIGIKGLLLNKRRNDKPKNGAPVRERVLKANDGMQSLTDDAIFAMIDSFERKIPYFSGHSRRVADISKRIGEKIGIKDLNGLYYAALLHDVGKVYIPDKLLNKSKLSMTLDERAEWNNHPVSGAQFISSIPELRRYANAVMHHHERYDGSGYPSALSAEDIPIFSRIIGVADAYEAMSSERSGREAYPREYIMSEFRKCSGNQFDPNIVRAIMSVIADMSE